MIALSTPALNSSVMSNMPTTMTSSMTGTTIACYEYIRAISPSKDILGASFVVHLHAKRRIEECVCVS